ncbi:hypothetical protein C8R48DRAFT_670525 [Suillus tomentosus]|nr:hypothetical protein C8R48DRAFT_670525 [Suillus tomentosus]
MFPESAPYSYPIRAAIQQRANEGNSLQLASSGKLMDKELRDVKKEAKCVMHRKVLLKNVMPTMEQNTEMAEEAFLEVAGHTCKQLSGIMTTVCGVFKKEVQRLIFNHYSLSLEAGDTRSLTDHRETTVAMLLVNHSYLFVAKLASLKMIQQSCPLSTTPPSLRQSVIPSGPLIFMKCSTSISLTSLTTYVKSGALQSITLY